MNVSQFSITCKRTNNANNTTHYVTLGKKRRESSKRNDYIISARVIIKAIIITCHSTNTRIHAHTYTYAGYPKDTGVTLLTLANPENLLCYYAPRSALLVSTLTHSWGRGPSHQLACSNIETYGPDQVCGKGHQGNSGRSIQPFLCGQILACTESATSEHSTTSLCISVLLGPAKESEVWPLPYFNTHPYFNALHYFNTLH